MASPHPTLQGGDKSDSAVDSHARRIFQDIQREKLYSGSGQQEAHNRGVQYRLERLRDRAEFGENLENVIELNGTECPWTFGSEPYDTKENPNNDSNVTRKYWRNVDRAGYEECQRAKQEEGTPNYNKVYQKAEDGNPKFLMTKHPTMPYCVRCEMPKEVKTDYETMVKKIENIAKTMSVSRRKKQWEQRAALVEKMERYKKQWNELYDRIYFGKDVSHFAVPNMGCMDPDATASAWRDPNDLKNVDAEDVREIIEDDGTKKKVWNRPFATRDPSSGKYYCARADDPNLVDEKEYHNLQELREFYNTDDASIPRMGDGEKRTLADVYNRTAFCTQRNSQTSCENSMSQDGPLGERLRPVDDCKWDHNWKHGGRCWPKDTVLQTSGTNQGEPADDRFSRWVGKFQKMEQELVKNRDTMKDGFSRQRLAGAVQGGGSSTKEATA